MRLEQLTVPLVLDNTKYGKALDKAGKGTKAFGAMASGGLSIVGDAFTKLAVVGVASLAAITGIMIAFSAKAISMAADAEEMLSKLSVTFGDSASDMEESMAQFAKQTGRSKFELMEQATNLGAVTKALGFTSEEAFRLSYEMTRLAVDVGSFNNLPSEEVAKKFTSALTGEFESLKSLGIIIKQTTLDQELKNMGVKDGIKKATDMQKALAVEAIIVRQTSDAHGDATNTAGSWTNQMIALKSSIKDTTTEIGLKMLPALTPLLSMFGDMADNILPKVVKWFEEKVVPVLENVSGVLLAIKEHGFGSIEMWEALDILLGEDVSGTLEDVYDWLVDVKEVLEEELPPAIEEFETIWNKRMIPAWESLQGIVEEVDRIVGNFFEGLGLKSEESGQSLLKGALIYSLYVMDTWLRWIAEGLEKVFDWLSKISGTKIIVALLNLDAEILDFLSRGTEPFEPFIDPNIPIEEYEEEMKGRRPRFAGAGSFIPVVGGQEGGDGARRIMTDAEATKIARIFGHELDKRDTRR